MGRRHQQSLAGGSDGHSRGKVRIISLVHHHGNQNGTQGSRICRGRTGDTAEEIGSNDIHHGHTAPHPSHAGIGQGNQLLGNTSGPHETPHGNEKGHCHQAEGADALYHLLTDGSQGISLVHQAEHGGKRHRIGNGEAQEYHDKNCENIERYNEIAEGSFENDIRKLPRIVVIIDEFHEMFSDSESNIAKECEKLLERIVRQGRALGIHVILASQTLPDNLSSIYGQIMNRIALQSTAASAQYILDPNNEEVSSLVTVNPGAGIYNDGGGNRDANHKFKGALLQKKETKELLERIKTRQKEIFGHLEMEKPRLLLSSIQDDNENPLNQFVKTGSLSHCLELGCPLYLGEEIAMVNEFSIRLTSRRAQNLLILGSDYRRANLLYGFSAMSILFNAFRQSGNEKLPNEPIITYFDFGKSNAQGGRLSKNSIDIMNELSARFPYAIRVFGKDSLMDGIDILQKECTEKESHSRHYVIFAGLNRARRLLDNDSAYAMSPKQVFSNLIKNGPQSGHNFIIWANEPGSFCSFYGDLIPEFDYRLVYNLKEEEYEQVIKSSEMNTDYGNNNVISYSPDEDNKKVRIYSMPLLGWFTQFMDRLEGKNINSEDGFWSDEEFADDF